MMKRNPKKGQSRSRGLVLVVSFSCASGIRNKNGMRREAQVPLKKNPGTQ